MSRRIIAWGSYDKSKPRVRLLLDEISKQGVLQADLNIPVWNRVRDKAIASPATIVATMFRLLVSYPGAMLKLLRQPRGMALLLAYPAIPDIFFAWPIARLRGHIIIFDAFISVHDTIVSDRRLATAGSLASKAIWLVEKLALSLADIILVDTDQHADFFSSEFGIPRDRFQTVMVGAEEAFWMVRDAAGQSVPELPVPSDLPIVLFYGQLIPLHGLDTIIDAIRTTAGEPFHWLIVGSGQDQPKLKQFLDAYDGANVSWVPWVDYHRLPEVISLASAGLGIFGSGDKASRVIPNKLYQILAAGKPVITRASPAVDPIAARYPRAVFTIPAGDGAALADAVRNAIANRDEVVPVPATDRSFLSPQAGVAALSQKAPHLAASDQAMETH